MTIAIPTTGRMVHYVAVLPDVLKSHNPGYCKILPATVVEATDLHVNMVVLSMASTPASAQYSVPHESIVPRNEANEPVMSYWRWPEIK